MDLIVTIFCAFLMFSAGFIFAIGYAFRHYEKKYTEKLSQIIKQNHDDADWWKNT